MCAVNMDLCLCEPNDAAGGTMSIQLIRCRTFTSFACSFFTAVAGAKLVVSLAQKLVVSLAQHGFGSQEKERFTRFLKCV